MFSIKESNIYFKETTNNDVVVNTVDVQFILEDPDSFNENIQIPVGEETRQLICVGNKSKNQIAF
jgi:hypothetical protein